jgi:hypothetical protein
MSYEITGNNLIAAITGGVFVLMPVAESVSETVSGIQTFDEILVTNVPLLLSAFGGAGIYQPGVLDRSIQGIIRYVQDDATVAPVVRHRGPLINLKVANNSVTGISANEFEQGQVVSIPPRKGAAAREFQMARIVSQDAGFVVYEVH